jgi:hypothetical protein
MHIIFKENLTEQFQKYTVLDLDTFEFDDGSKHTACCLVENIPVQELPLSSSLRELHANLIKNYAQKNWTYCEHALEQLTGKWNGELDTFYVELTTRIKHLKTLDLPDTWTPVIRKK